MSKHETTRSRRVPAAFMVAVLSLAACYDGAERATGPTVPAAEQARMDAERAENIKKLQALNIGNSSIRAEVDSGSISMAEATKATFDSVKAYVDYANSKNLSLNYNQYNAQTGDSTTCNLKLDAEKSVVMFVSMKGFGRASYDTHMTIAPDRISYDVYVMGSGNEGVMLEGGEVTASQLAEVVPIISDVQTSFLEPDTYCGMAVYLTEVLTK